jgi:hypothetical protein
MHKGFENMSVVCPLYNLHRYLGVVAIAMTLLQVRPMRDFLVSLLLYIPGATAESAADQVYAYSTCTGELNVSSLLSHLCHLVVACYAIVLEYGCMHALQPAQVPGSNTVLGVVRQQQAKVQCKATTDDQTVFQLCHAAVT